MITPAKRKDCFIISLVLSIGWWPGRVETISGNFACLADFTPNTSRNRLFQQSDSASKDRTTFASGSLLRMEQFLRLQTCKLTVKTDLDRKENPDESQSI
jgi:hypothetical protein